MRRFALTVLFGLCTIGLLAAQTTQTHFKNRSVTVTLGNVYQKVSNPGGGDEAKRKNITIQNNNTNSDFCWLDYTGLISSGMGTTSSVTTANQTITAAQASILLTQGGAAQRLDGYIPSDAIMVACANPGDSVYVEEE